MEITLVLAGLFPSFVARQNLTQESTASLSRRTKANPG